MTTHKTLSNQATTLTTSQTQVEAGTDYDRFSDLAARLVKVPKAELDEVRERERLAKG